MKNKNKQNKKITLEEKARKYLAIMQKCAGSLDLGVRPIIIFPNPKSLYAKLSMYFLKKSKAGLDTQFSNIDPNK